MTELHKIENSAGGTVFSSYICAVNPITQRTSVATAGTAFAGWKSIVEYSIHNSLSWGYDALGQVIVRREYDPFGPNAVDFAYRFSTKPRDAATGLCYFGYRWFDPYAGRWLSRDPIGERGGLNLYGFVGNNVPALIGLFGLFAKGTIEITGRNVKVDSYSGNSWEIGRESLVGLLWDTAQDVGEASAAAILEGYFEGRGNEKGVERVKDLTEKLDKIREVVGLSDAPLVTAAKEVLVSTGGLYRFELSIYAKCCVCEENSLTAAFGPEFKESRVVTDGGGEFMEQVEYWPFRGNLTNKALYAELSRRMVETWVEIAREVSKKCKQ